MTGRARCVLMKSLAVHPTDVDVPVLVESDVGGGGQVHVLEVVWSGFWGCAWGIVGEFDDSACEIGVAKVGVWVCGDLSFMHSGKGGCGEDCWGVTCNNEGCPWLVVGW